MSSAIDLESGQCAQAPLRAGVGGSDSAVRGAQQVVSQAETTDETSSAYCCIPSGVFCPLPSMRGGSNIDHSKRNVSDQSTQTGQGLSLAEAQIPMAGNPTLDSGHNANTDSKSEEPRMIGDFDGSAGEFWKLFKGEANSHDDARIKTLKEGMDSSLIFAGLFSAALTAFVVDSKQNLKSSPADETVYYLRQHSVILSQISAQLSSIAPQVAIPSTPPPPSPSFSPLASDVRVNVFWFMALAFSLLAALLAILIQQWVRKYMHVFERYGDPLKSSRLRQYLYEGCETWYMPKVAEAVPGCLHISLFLFFAGLVDLLLNINKRVAQSTIVPISVSGLLYIFMIFVPIIYPQSPYQNSFSGIFWYLFQKSCGRRFRDRRSGGKMKPVSTNMAQGQMQLAMEETDARKDRDERAIRWLIDNLTEDAEMENFLSAIPGSFSTDWGTKVWKRVSEHHKSGVQSEDEPVARSHTDTTAHQPSSSWSVGSVIRPIVHLVRKPTPRQSPTHETTPNYRPHSTIAHIQEENVLYELGTRVARSVEICRNRKLLPNNETWRKRTHACIEVTALFVCCANAKLAWFGDISTLLGGVEDIRKLSLAGKDELFVTRWTCLSIVAIQQILEDPQVQRRVTHALDWFAKADDAGNKDAVAAPKRIYEPLRKASNCLFRLYDVLHKTEDLTKEVKEILRGHESQIAELEQINTEANHLYQVDSRISSMQHVINTNSHHITSRFPGILDDFGLYNQTPIPFSRLVEPSGDRRNMPLQFIRPGQTLKSMCSPATTLHNILEGQGDVDAYKELLKNLKNFRISSGWQGDEMQRLLWRLQDLRDGGRLGFTVELFFLALEQLLSKSSSKESHLAIYTGTFRVITSDWSKLKDLHGTHNLLLDITISRRREFDVYYPAYIVDEFVLLLGKIFKGQTGPHIDNARKQFESFNLKGPRRFKERVLKVLSRGQT